MILTGILNRSARWMGANDLRHWPADTLTIETNGYWVYIRNAKGNAIFRREPGDKEWLDGDHKAVVHFLDFLERVGNPPQEQTGK